MCVCVCVCVCVLRVCVHECFCRLQDAGMCKNKSLFPRSSWDEGEGAGWRLSLMTNRVNIPMAAGSTAQHLTLGEQLVSGWTQQARSGSCTLEPAAVAATVARASHAGPGRWGGCYSTEIINFETRGWSCHDYKESWISRSFLSPCHQRPLGRHGFLLRL